MDNKRVAGVVLAAGEGKRLKSDLPKVLHLAAGKALVVHVFDALAGVDLAARVAVVSRSGDEIREVLGSEGHANVEYAVQDPPRGTGDALRVALPHAGSGIDAVLVTNGDSPLLRTETVSSLIHAHLASSAGATMLTATAPGTTDGGRIVRGRDGNVERIVETRDATPDELLISEVNAGIYVFDVDGLAGLLDALTPDNSQGEYYLTDVISMLQERGRAIQAFPCPWEETLGVNDRVHLAEVAAILRRRTAEHWMHEGATIVDPASTFIDSTVTIDRDAVIMPFTFLEGATSIGEGAEVGPQTRLIDTKVAAGASVTFSVARGSVIGPESSVGPYASLRPGTTLERRSKIGTFVETKNTTIGDDSKANHLSYLGDAVIGRGVNVGAGTITCNWDGKEKHQTVIDDEAYISSDTMLVAPVRIGKRAATGAGSVVRDDVPDDSLAVGVPARIIPGRGDRMGKHPEGEQGG
ncbi:MAG: bifunctional UDP-N-acetylglucosamine diphosphorylase/glucosamine-1-phosphate N-acetyltransferase GlmU [Actinomycetota bacterium]